MNRLKPLWACCFAACSCMLWAAQESSGLDPFEPTVTPEESDLLQQAVELSRNDPAAAAALLRERDRSDGSAAIDYALGNFLFQGGRLEEAEQAYQAAVDKFPSFRAALSNLGRVYLVRDQPVRAREVFQGLLRDGQADAPMLRLLGHCLLLEDRPVSAEGAFRQSLVLEPGDPEAMRGLTKTLIEQGRTHEVLGLTRELLGERPDDAELWSLRANAHLALEQFDEAIVTIETAHALGAAGAPLLALLGDLYLNRGQPREAVAAYRAAFAGEAPSVEHLLRAVDGLVALGALDEADDLLRRMGAGVEEDEFPADQARRRRFLEGRLAELRGDTGEAIKAYTQVLRIDPLDGDALLAMADLRAAVNEIEVARMLYERAGRIEGYEARASALLARLEVAQGRYRSAVGLLETAQTFDAKPHVARYLEQVRRLAER